MDQIISDFLPFWMQQQNSQSQSKAQENLFSKSESVNGLLPRDLLTLNETKMENTDSEEPCSDVGIQNLPDEVLVYILSLVSPYQDLHNSARVCRQWRHCVQQVVHQRKSNFIKAVNQMKLLWTKVEHKDDSKLMISRRYSHSGTPKPSHNFDLRATTYCKALTYIYAYAYFYS